MVLFHFLRLLLPFTSFTIHAASRTLGCSKRLSSSPCRNLPFRHLDGHRPLPATSPLRVTRPCSTSPGTVPFPSTRHRPSPQRRAPISPSSVRLRFRSGLERAIDPFRTRCDWGFVSFRIEASFRVPRFRFTHRSNPGERRDDPRSEKEAMGFDRLDVHTTSGRWISAQPRRLRDFDAPQNVASRVWGRKRWRWKERRSSRRGGREETRPNKDMGRKAKHSNVGSNSSRQ